MSYDTPACPTCGAALSHRDDGDFNPWVCPRGHGLAATLSEGYERIEGDELRDLWQRARARKTPSPRPCPMCGAAMVVTEAPTTGGGAQVPVDVCTDDELLWFDIGELEELPRPTAGEPVPAEDQAHIDQIMQSFDDGLDDAFAERERDGLLSQMADRMTAHNRLLGSLTGGRQVERAD